MTATYNTSSPTDRDRLRLKIGDTNMQFPIFTDLELDMFLDDEPDVLLAAAACCRSIATSRARQAVMLTLPGVTISKTSIPATYSDMADAFEKQAVQRAAPTSVNVYTDDASTYDTMMGRTDADVDNPAGEADG